MLDVTVGDGQRAFVEVLLDNVVIKTGHQIVGLTVGTGSDLRGRRLRVTTAVTDTNPATNHTSVTYQLTGGAADRTVTSEYTVSSAGGTVDYDAIFPLL